jgi:hypothetical protein
MKQTAVEFAFEELNKWRIQNFGEDSLIGIPQEVLDKAKEMEKEQIMEAFKCGKRPTSYNLTAEQYYKETFKSE